MNKLSLFKRLSIRRHFQYVDVARGIAAIFVLISHRVIDNPVLANFISLFNMALFFILSGMCITYNKSFFKYFKSRYAQLMFPLIFALPFLWVLRFKGYPTWFLGKQMYSLVYCAEYNVPDPFVRVPWFLPCLLVTNLIFFGLLKAKQKFKFNNLVLFSFCALLAVFGFCLSNFGHYRINWCISLPYSLDIALIAQLYMYCGYHLRDFLKKTKKMSGLIFAMSLSLWLIFFFITQFVGGTYLTFSLLERKISLPGLIASACASLVFIYISILIAKVKYVKIPFMWLGTASIIPYLYGLERLSLIEVFRINPILSRIYGLKKIDSLLE